MSDASFEDGGDRPLALRALDAEDLKVISSLAQDAVFPISEIKWERRRRRFALLINRFRWEDRAAAERSGRSYERVRSLLVFEDVLAVQSNGVDPSDHDMVLSLLSIEFEPGEDGTGRMTLVLAGDGAIMLEVECIEVILRDVTRAYAAPSGAAPQHPGAE